MNSRFIDIVALLDDAVLNDIPIIIDSCIYYVEWDGKGEMYHLTHCFDDGFSLELGQIDEWKMNGHEIVYNG